MLYFLFLIALFFSGGHVNPAVTTGLASIKKCSLKHMASYVIAQYIGSFLAAGVIYLIYIGKFGMFVLYISEFH